MEKITELRALLGKATPGKWEVAKERSPTGRIIVSAGGPPIGDNVICGVELRHGQDPEPGRANAELMAAAKNALPLLLEIAEAAKKDLAHHEAPEAGECQSGGMPNTYDAFENLRRT